MRSYPSTCDDDDDDDSLVRHMLSYNKHADQI